MYRISFAASASYATMPRSAEAEDYLHRLGIKKDQELGPQWSTVVLSVAVWVKFSTTKDGWFTAQNQQEWMIDYSDSN